MGREEWRLIRSGYLPGAMNMALDDALLHAVADGASPPILRLYRWQPAALSVGYAQSLDSGVDLAACRAAGLDVVRRPTGGRAVLHAREVTYAVLAPAGGLFGTSIAECYRTIAGALQRALCSLGLAAELVPGRTRGGNDRAVCFTAPAQHELLVDGCKIAGCSQKRRKQAFLQHGSIPLDLDLDLLERIMPLTAGEEAAGRRKTIGWLNRFSAHRLTVDQVEEAVVNSCAEVFAVDFVESAPSADELSLAGCLRGQWYADPVWTEKGPGGTGGSVASPMAIECSSRA